MDYWDYLAHSQQGTERKDHRYYARVQTGSRNGRAVYRYFYTADEYAAYKNEANRNLNRQKNSSDREKTRTGILAQKVQMDAARYRKKRFADGVQRRKKEKRAMDWERTQKGIRKEKTGMDRKRNRTSILAEKVQMDAERYRKKRRAAEKAKRIGEQHSMDRKRYARNQAQAIGEQHSADRTRWDTEARAAQVKKDATAYRRKRTQTSIRAEKVQMDAKRYRRKRREEGKKRRAFQKRVMDNTRTRKGYQPKMV